MYEREGRGVVFFSIFCFRLKDKSNRISLRFGRVVKNSFLTRETKKTRDVSMTMACAVRVLTVLMDDLVSV